jgi:LPXTG-motif cell wall-anchored protein
MTTNTIIFIILFLAVIALFVFLVVKKREKKNDMKVFNPEDAVTQIFRHMDDV